MDLIEHIFSQILLKILFEVLYWVLIVNWVIFILKTFSETIYYIVFVLSCDIALRKGVRTREELERYGDNKGNLSKGSFFQGFYNIKDGDTAPFAVGFTSLVFGASLILSKLSIFIGFVWIPVIFLLIITLLHLEGKSLLNLLLD